MMLMMSPLRWVTIRRMACRVMWKNPAVVRFDLRASRHMGEDAGILEGNKPNGHGWCLRLANREWGPR